MKIILETPRMVLREMSLDDLDCIAAMLAHPEVMRFYPKCYSREEAEEWIWRQLDRYGKQGFGFWLALDGATGEPVGQIGLLTHEQEGIDVPDIGYIIHRPFWRRGLATEGAAAARDYALDVLGHPRVICLVRPENEPSRGVARKIGMTPEDRTVQLAGFTHQVFSMSRGDPR
jgi:RimJ/RimL family protein N-acetyltransferase